MPEQCRLANPRFAAHYHCGAPAIPHGCEEFFELRELVYAAYERSEAGRGQPLRGSDGAARSVARGGSSLSLSLSQTANRLVTREAAEQTDMTLPGAVEALSSGVVAVLDLTTHSH
jgi:hypothetical protein